MATQLKPTLGTAHLWSIAVGLVISGEYIGWSYGWGAAGTLVVATMYTCFIFSFTARHANATAATAYETMQYACESA